MGSVVHDSYLEVRSGISHCDGGSNWVVVGWGGVFWARKVLVVPLLHLHGVRISPESLVRVETIVHLPVHDDILSL